MEKQINDQAIGQADLKKAHICPHCHNELSGDRVHRGFFVKNFLFFLPLKRYLCYKCSKKSYIWIN